MTPDQIAHVTKCSLSGMTHEAIADQVGVHRVTVSRTLSKPDVRSQIEAIQKRVMDEAAEQAASNVIFAVNYYQSPGEKITVTAKDGSTYDRVVKDEQLRDHGFKASMRLMEGIGVLPSHSQAPMVINILNQGNITLSPAITQVLQQVMVGEPVKLPDLGLVDNPVDNPVDRVINRFERGK